MRNGRGKQRLTGTLIGLRNQKARRGGRYNRRYRVREWDEDMDNEGATPAVNNLVVKTACLRIHIGNPTLQVKYVGASGS